MRVNSLALRLFVSATAWAVAILLITGLVLSSIYRQAVERAFDRRLDVYLRTLVADVASPEETGDKFPQSLGEPLFELPLSGWYWQVTRLDPDKHDVRASRSLWDAGLPHLQDRGVPAGPDGTRQGYVEGAEDQRLRLVERNIDLGDEGHYLVAVAGDAAEIADETRSFDRALIITFSILAAVLLLTTMFQVRFGLAPLKRITDSLAAIRSGSAERLAGQFPEEIAPLARETNALIDANKEIVERARTHVGNLAHALKTPLSVMVNEAARASGRSFRRQGAGAGRHHARPGGAPSRARAAGGAAHRGRLDHRSRAGGHGAGAHHGEDPPRPRHRHRRPRRGRRALPRRAARSRRDDRQSGGQRLQVGDVAGGDRGGARASRSGERRHVLRIVVDDDGRGLSPSEREQVAQRGSRLDETKPGSGLGLSIVVELAALYGGELKLGAAPLGGLRAELVLPAA